MSDASAMTRSAVHGQFALGTRGVARLLALVLATSGLARDVQAVPVRGLVEVVDISAPTVSPDGRMVAFQTEQGVVERNTYDTAWYVQPLDGSAPARRIADGGLPFRGASGVSVPESPVWSADGRWLFFRALIDGDVAVWRAAADGSGAAPVTRDAADIRAFVLDEDGRTLTYSVGATREAIVAEEMAEYARGIRIDASVPLGQGLFRSSPLGARLATQRYTGNWFDRDGLLSNTPVRWKAVDLATGLTTDLAETDAPARSAGQGQAPAWREAAWQVSEDVHAGRIALLTRIGEGAGVSRKPDVQLSALPGRAVREPVVCTAELCRDKAITSIQWRPGHTEVLFTVSDPAQAWAQGIFRWNVDTGDVRPVSNAEGLVSGGRDAYSKCGVSRDALVCVAASADQPPRLERIKIETGEHQILFEPNAALASDLTRQPRARVLRWHDASGQAYTGHLFPVPSGVETPTPLFVTYYSCQGFLRGGVGDEWPLASLAAHGIAALCINQVPEFSLDPVVRYGKGLAAVESVIDVLASTGEIDPARVGMGGLSFGSEVTMWTAMHSDLLAAASVSSPMLSPTYWLMGSLMGDDFTSELERVWQIGAPEKAGTRWQLLSPALNLDRIAAPLLMQLPEQEHLHALDYAVPLIRDRRADLYVFPHEPHLKFQPKHKLAVYERNLDWFLFWLKGVEADGQEKAAQYSHWRAMRARKHELRAARFADQGG